jgi:hypothetical protein
MRERERERLSDGMPDGRETLDGAVTALLLCSARPKSVLIYHTINLANCSSSPSYVSPRSEFSCVLADIYDRWE